MLFVFAFLPLAGASGQGYVSGKVYDSQTMEPLPRATVFSGRGGGAVTDVNGGFFLRMDEGQASIVFRYIGYKSVEQSVLVVTNDTVFLEVGLDPDAAEIDQVVVSAGKVEQRISELTVSLNIIKPETISSSHVTGATELMNQTPGIEVLGGQASIRGGSGFSYGAGSRVLALIDGLPVISADAGDIKWQYLPLENISQIEIIKGASSVLYGSSALNGVINFRTARPGKVPVTRFFIESGVFDKPRRGEWLWWDSPRMFHSTSISHSRRAGNTDLGMALHLLNDNGYRKLNDESLGRVNIVLRHDDRNREGLSYGVNLNAGATKKRDFLLWENASTGGLKQAEASANRLYGSLITIDPFVRLNRGTRASHNLQGRFQRSENRFPVATQNNSSALSFLAEYQFVYIFSPIFTLNSGVIENFSRISSEFYGDHEALNLAAFAQADISLTERLRFVAGVRTEYNTLDGESDRLVPLFRAGANFRLLDYTFLRASFGQGYRYPSIAEKHAATTIGSVRIVPNPDIQPESGWSSEIGIKQGVVAGRVSGQVDLALFYSENKDMIEYRFGFYPFPEPGFKAFNVEQSRVYGAEIEFSIAGYAGRFENFLSGGYVFIYPVEFNPISGQNTDIFLKYRRKHSLKINLGTQYGKIDMGLSLRAGSRILNIDDVFLHPVTGEAILPGFPEYWENSAGGHLVIDPRAGYKINNSFRISIVVKNVLNTEYMGRPGDIMPHRNYSIRLSGTL